MDTGRVFYQGLHHVGLLVENLERSLEFYQGVLGLELNHGRPDNKLPYRGAWLWIGRSAHVAGILSSRCCAYFCIWDGFALLTDIKVHCMCLAVR
jgi:catechol 2,3-dioxygenase-like lactoylglutathione lyase family enzyme